jgi:hypothetical protein
MTNDAKTEPLLAFHGDKAIKAKYLKRIRAHQKADEIISGTYWENGKGCSVGCILHSSDHSEGESQIGVPTILMRLNDRLFEGLFQCAGGEVAKAWPERFVSASMPGADLSLVWPKFALWLLSDPESGVIKFAKREATIAAIKLVSALYVRWAAGDKPATSEWQSARKISLTAYRDAAYAAYAASAYSAYAYADAASAYSAYAYADAASAYADAASAYAAYAYADAADARSEHYQKMADKLIELMKAAKKP